MLSSFGYYGDSYRFKSSSFISFKNKIITENSSKKNKNNKNRTGEATILLLPQPTVNERSKKNMY